jgi:hypothetical protein
VAQHPEAEWAPRRFWVAHQVAGTPLESVIGNGVAPKSAAIEVYAAHDRWIAECPDCCGAQLASLNDRRFMCNNCGNAMLGGLWRPLVWPKNHAEIDALLDARPNVENRNWNPGETIGDLRAEEPRPEPTDPREHAIWAGLSAELADAMVAGLPKRKKAR